MERLTVVLCVCVCVCVCVCDVTVYVCVCTGGMVSKWCVCVWLSEYRNQELYRLWLVTIQCHVNKIELNYYLYNSFQMQYKLIFQAVLAFLDSFDTYANF